MRVEWVPLRDILSPRDGVAVDAATRYPVGGVYGFGRGVLLRGTILGLETGYKTLTRLTTGDVVYSKLKAFEGAIACAHQEADGRYVSPEFPVFSVDPSVSWRYLEHVLQSPRFIDNLARASAGIGARRERVHPSRFIQLEVPLPTRMRQDRIADYLTTLSLPHRRSSGSLDSLIDRLIARKTAGARISALGSLIELRRRPLNVDAEGIYREVGVRSFGKGLFVKEPVTGAELGGKRVFQIEEGDFIVSNVFGWEGAVGVAGPAHRGLIGSHRFMTWTPRGDLNVEYLRAYFRSKAGVARLATASPGSAGRNRTLSIANFEATEIPVPTRPEQDRIVAGIQVVDEITAVSKRADDLAAAILPAARNEIFSAMR